MLDYWKSCPRSVAFMQGHYRIRKKLRRDGDLRPTIKTLSRGFDANLKLRHLAAAVLGRPEWDPQKLRQWKFLWAAPRYGYWNSAHFEGCEPTKLLVFSHWRFVPGAVALLMSDAIERALRISDTRAWKRGRLLRLVQATITLYSMSAFRRGRWPRTSIPFRSPVGLSDRLNGPHWKRRRKPPCERHLRGQVSNARKMGLGLRSGLS